MLITASEIIRQSTALYFNNWKKAAPFLLISSGIVVLGALLSYIAIILEIRLGVPKILNDIVLVAVLVMGAIISFWSYLGLIKIFNNKLQNTNDVSFGIEMMSVKHLIWAGIYTSVMAGLIVALGFLLLVIPGIIFLVWYQFSMSVLVVEEKKGVPALKASKDLVTGRWFSVFWRIVGPTLFYVVIMGVIQLIIERLIRLFTEAGAPDYLAATSFVTNIIGIMFVPFMVGAALILYQNLKNTPAPNGLTNK